MERGKEHTNNFIRRGKYKKYWWTCSKCGHEYEARLDGRLAGGGCPACSGKVVKAGYNDLATTHPEIAKDWHHTKNLTLKPTDVSKGSTKHVWWKCSDCGYEWESIPGRRTCGYGCKQCAAKRNGLRYKRLSESDPALAAEWNYEKNYPLTPDDVTMSVNKRVWWKCPTCHYEWQAVIHDRHYTTFGCPACTNRIIKVGETDLQTTHPTLAIDWHPFKNGDLTAQHVSHGSDKKVWWLCHTCGNEWKATINSRQKNGCPFCAGKRAVPGKTDLATLNPQLASEWDNIKNAPLTPQNVTIGAKKKIWWICSKCSYNWQSLIQDRSRGIGCPACSGQAIHVGFNDLQTLYPKIAQEWHPTKNGTLTPRDVTRGHKKKIWWKCSECGNEWQATPNSRTSQNCGCPKCAIRKSKAKRFRPLSETDATLAEEWDYDKNYPLTPDDVYTTERKYAWWRCKTCGHSWWAELSARHYGNGCPKCAESCGERKVSHFLNEYHIAYIQNKTIGKVWKWYYKAKKHSIEYKSHLALVQHKRYDFVLQNNKNEIFAIIEFDGTQHFSYNAFFTRSVKQYLSRCFEDHLKNRFAEEHQIPLLRIKYDQINQVEEAIADLLKNPQNYLKNHAFHMSDKEYWSELQNTIQTLKQAS